MCGAKYIVPQWIILGGNAEINILADKLDSIVEVASLHIDLQLACITGTIIYV